MILNRPAIDWLTLTTFSRQTQMEMARILNRLLPDFATQGVDGRIRQYDGKRGEGWFVGAGPQKGHDHYIFRFSGDLSDAVTWQPVRPPIDCTRLDLQLTLPLPVEIGQAYEAYKSLVDDVHESEKKRGQRARGVDAIISPDGFCTLYLGSRESGRFYRLYVKESSGDYFLRFEVEYKKEGGFSGRVWRDTARRPDQVVIWLKGEIETLPDHELTRPFLLALTGSPSDIMKGERRRSDPHKTLEWLKRQVDPSIKRLIGNEDTRDAAIILLTDWLRFAANQGELITQE